MFFSQQLTECGFRLKHEMKTVQLLFLLAARAEQINARRLDGRMAEHVSQPRDVADAGKALVHGNLASFQNQIDSI